MKLKRLTPAIEHTIWSPRYHDRVVLIANNKLGHHNIIEFTKAPTMAGKWYVSGETARKYHIEEMRTKSGGTLAVRPIPLDELQVFEGREDV